MEETGQDILRPLGVTVVGVWEIVFATYFGVVFGGQFVLAPSTGRFTLSVLMTALIWVTVLVMRGSWLARTVYLWLGILLVIVFFVLLYFGGSIAVLVFAFIGLVPLGVILYLPSSNKYFSAVEAAANQARKGASDDGPTESPATRKDWNGPLLKVLAALLTAALMMCGMLAWRYFFANGPAPLPPPRPQSSASGALMSPMGWGLP